MTFPILPLMASGNMEDQNNLHNVTVMCFKDVHR